ncbi:T9SS type B sorting domain-containing protein [Flavobacterium amniphilum]|uniref:T9SS type B sorting domain-containing protein n=1 Tax=Flavobacterium amniphilum TaxID=1834035 RepID=UPI002029FFF9|nr:T9SS type B sorting domain-containing protein [Flavobacterium amniphilum]MCL9806453.1 T9SS type B sorting domain-containing protein [Flavobacterium amniphilum]
MKLKLFLFLFFCVTVMYSQGETNIWYFGNKAGLDFNSGIPVALTNSQMDTHEGCAVLSNSAGQMLFYSNGVNVWNKNHQIMLNGSGLLGNESSTQACVIVPKPGSASLYYIFTTDDEANSDGFKYSVVDMTLDGGLGAVTNEKNVDIYTPTTEKLTVVKHSNNIDYWIITHGWNNNRFYSYLLKSTGLEVAPVITDLGIVTPRPLLGSGADAVGAMKVSPDGSKLIACHYITETAELFDFNKTTGVLSNHQILSSWEREVYSAEFSVDNKVLYISRNGKIVQYDLTANPISSSAFVLNQNDHSSHALSMQLGPDNKIYVALISSNKIAVINQPGVLGSGCDFQNSSIDLGGRICRSGLPTFVQSFFVEDDFRFVNACVGENTEFNLNMSLPILSATWDFGDGSPPQNNVIGSHIYSVSGNYTVSVTVTTAGGTIVKARTINISAVPTATQPADVFVCDTDNNGLHTFDLTSRNTTILNGQNASQYLIRYFANATDYANNVAIATPNAYPNTTAYQQQTIIAEVYNKDNSDCKTATSFGIDVFDMPRPSTVIAPLTICDNTSFGTDTDGRVRFDLTQRAAAILNGQPASQFGITYYTDAGMTNVIATPNNYVNSTAQETVYVKVSNTDNPNCFATTSFTVEVFSLPTVVPVVSLKQCDDNTDGFSAFNLIQANALVSANYQNETFRYFETAADAQNNINPIANYTAYVNQIVSNDVVYVRVSNASGCFRVAQLNLNVSTTQIPMNFSRSFTVCDDAVQGSNADGISAFDFSSVTGQMQSVFPAGQQLIITYYRNLNDALAEQNAITDTANYRNIGYPNTQNIYIRVDSAVNNDCLGLGQHITLNVERIPVVQPQVLQTCDDDQDGLFGFDTSQLQNNLLNGLTNVTVAYFDQNNNPLPGPLPNPFTTATQTIRAVVTNNTTTACDYSTTIRFIVDDLPEAFPVAASLTTVCDDEANPLSQDGRYGFDTSSFQSTILGSQTGMTVLYFDQNNNPLPSPLPNPFVTATQNVRVEVINPANTSCKAVYTIPFVVHPVPKINLSGNEIVCNALTIIKTLDAGIVDGTSPADYTYVWSKDGVVIPNETNYTLNVNQEGTYTVEVTNVQGCSRIRTISVVASDLATITHVEVKDLSNNNTVVVEVSGNGDYVYSLNNIDFQSSNTFDYVPAGVYTLYVQDLNGCGTASMEISVLGIPNYFTPNGDGYHDYWNMEGIGQRTSAKIMIFDRFGKLIKQISLQSQGWDGTYAGNPLPSADYWYTVELADGRILKGHFAMKR